MDRIRSENQNWGDRESLLRRNGEYCCSTLTRKTRPRKIRSLACLLSVFAPSNTSDLLYGYLGVI
eukprot:3759531-Ditylum_brightwellii.AAC.1